MPSFRVCSKSQVKSTVRQLDATHLLTLLDPQDSIYKPNRILPENWLWLRMEDEETPSHPNAPTKEQAARILEWGKSLPDDACVVVHCYAGVSRSTASGLALWLQSNGTEHVAEAEAWKQTGMVQGKTWLLAPDPCEFCEAAAARYGENGIGLGDSFFQKDSTLTGADGGEMVLDYENIDGPPLHPNCRCSMQPVFDDEMEAIMRDVEKGSEEASVQIRLEEGIK